MTLDLRKVKLLIGERGYSQRELASICGMSECTLTRILKGKGCRYKTMNKIANALCVKLEEIVVDDLGDNNER